MKKIKIFLDLAVIVSVIVLLFLIYNTRNSRVSLTSISNLVLPIIFVSTILITIIILSTAFTIVDEKSSLMDMITHITYLICLINLKELISHAVVLLLEGDLILPKIIVKLDIIDEVKYLIMSLTIIAFTSFFSIVYKKIDDKSVKVKNQNI